MRTLKALMIMTQGQTVLKTGKELNRSWTVSVGLGPKGGTMASGGVFWSCGVWSWIGRVEQKYGTHRNNPDMQAN
jgi:hypothetical protein